MNLDELRSVQNTERQKDSLQNLRPSFYQEVGEYIADLEAERDRIAEQTADPFSSPEVGRLTDEIETARDVVGAIYERRMGKLVKQASLAAAGLNADDEGLTAEEEDLFEDLVSSIESNKSRVLEVLDSGADPTAESTPAAEIDRESDAGADSVAGAVSDQSEPAAGSAETPPAPPEEPPEATGDGGLSPADAMGSGAADAAPEVPPDPTAGEDLESDAGDAPESGEHAGGEPAGPDPTPESTTGGSVEKSDGDAADVERVTVRITQDLGSILGVDAREYTLATDDVVTLPAENATPLVEREAAERLE